MCGFSCGFAISYDNNDGKTISIANIFQLNIKMNELSKLKERVLRQGDPKMAVTSVVFSHIHQSDVAGTGTIMPQC